MISTPSTAGKSADLMHDQTASSIPVPTCRPDSSGVPALTVGAGVEGADCEQCCGQGWYGSQICSGNPWESEQVQCEACHGTGKRPTESFALRYLDVMGKPASAALLAHLEACAARHGREAVERLIDGMGRKPNG